MNLEPMNGRLIVWKKGAEQDSIVFIPEEAWGPYWVIVQAVNSGIQTESGKRLGCPYAVGDELLIDVQSGKKILHEGKPFLLIKENEVMARLTSPVKGS